MVAGVLYVESQPTDDGSAEEYHRWYDEVHLPEVISSIDGIVSARRFATFDGTPFVALYEIESDDLAATMESVMEAGRTSRFVLSNALQTKPFPTVRLMRTISDVQGDSRCAL